MPKIGFKSITIAEIVYNRFYNAYKTKKNEFALKGINSFTGYITYMLENSMQKNDNLVDIPRLEKISADDDKIIIKDNINNRIIEITFRNKEPYCVFCEKQNCFHIGFVFAIPEYYKILSQNGIKIP